jgi:hypothetical protein
VLYRMLAPSIESLLEAHKPESEVSLLSPEVSHG